MSQSSLGWGRTLSGSSTSSTGPFLSQFSQRLLIVSSSPREGLQTLPPPPASFPALSPSIDRQMEALRARLYPGVCPYYVVQETPDLQKPLTGDTASWVIVPLLVLILSSRPPIVGVTTLGILDDSDEAGVRLFLIGCLCFLHDPLQFPD